MLFALILCSIKSTSDQMNLHFIGFTRSLYFQNLSETACRLYLCSSGEILAIKASSQCSRKLSSYISGMSVPCLEVKMVSVKNFKNLEDVLISFFNVFYWYSLIGLDQIDVLKIW